MQQLGVMQETRYHRLDDNESGLTAFQWTILTLGATLVIGFCFLLGTNNLRIDLLMTGTVAAMIALIFVLIYELDYPFRGGIGVQADRWVEFIADHKLHYDYNYFNITRYSIVSPTLPTGKVDLKFNFIKTGMFKGTGELYVNGNKVAEGALDKTVPGSFSLSETFDVGVDNGTPVSNNYKKKDHFPFTGQIDKVTIILTAPDMDKAKEEKDFEVVD